MTLIDFGLSKALLEEGDEEAFPLLATSVGKTFVGTPCYLAPEIEAKTGVPRCCGAFTPSTRLVSRNDGSGWSLFVFRGRSDRFDGNAPRRSHCLFTVFLECRGAGGSDKVRRSKLYLVDLAGSEDARETMTSGSTLKEAADINKSLFTLRKAIEHLALRKHTRSVFQVRSNTAPPHHPPTQLLTHIIFPLSL